MTAGLSRASIVRADAATHLGPPLRPFLTLERAGWCVLAALVVVSVPLLVRMGVWVDVTHYDLAARAVLGGGVHYRDVFDTNLPGTVWGHMIVRSLFGWSLEAIRLVDAAIVAGTIGMLARWVRDTGASRTVVVWTVVALTALYTGQPEWIHCQRDVWMLLPALAAMRLRHRQLHALAAELSHGLARRAALEGALWAVGAWLKPFVVVPAALCWLTSVAQSRLAGARGWRPVAVDLAGLLSGGAVIGGAGVAWLMASGTWPYFLDVMLNWNPEYGADVYGLHLRLRLIKEWIQQTRPWSLLALLGAFPVALAVVWRSRARAAVDAHDCSDRPALVLLAVFFLGWLLQAALLQPRVHPYVMAPVLLLALAVLASVVAASRLERSGGVLVAAALVVTAIAARQTLAVDRLSLWPASVTGAVTSAMRDRLSLFTSRAVSGLVEWEHLDRVAEFLRGQQVGDGDVLGMNDSTHPLYLSLGIEPPIRFMQFSIVAESFVSRRDAVRDQLATLPIRFVVGDVTRTGLPPDVEQIVVPDAWVDRYPWNQEMVFRAGRYVVFRHPPPGGDPEARRLALRFWRGFAR